MEKFTSISSGRKAALEVGGVYGELSVEAVKRGERRKRSKYKLSLNQLQYIIIQTEQMADDPFQPKFRPGLKLKKRANPTPF